MNDSPFGDSEALNIQLDVTIPYRLLSARIIVETFKERHRDSLNVRPPENPSWRSLKRFFRPYVGKIRKTRRELEQRYNITLPPYCIKLIVLRGENAYGPIVAEVNEKRVCLYRKT